SDITINAANGPSNSPDLRITGIDIRPNPLAIDGYAYASAIVINQNYGTYSVNSSFKVGIYLSTDSTITTADIKVAECVFPSMGSAPYVICENVFFEASSSVLTSGYDYYTGGIVDLDNSVVESN